MIVPGAGQAFAGAWRRGLVLFALFAFGAVPVVVVAAFPVETAAWLLEGRLLLAALAVNIFLLALRLFAALDAWRIGPLAESVPALVAAGAIGVLQSFRNEGNKAIDQGLGGDGATKAVALLEKIGDVFGVLGAAEEEKPPDEVVRLATERLEARKRKDFKAADAARDRIKALGWSVEDTKDGVKYRKL